MLWYSHPPELFDRLAALAGPESALTICAHDNILPVADAALDASRFVGASCKAARLALVVDRVLGVGAKGSRNLCGKPDLHAFHVGDCIVRSRGAVEGNAQVAGSGLGLRKHNMGQT